ncbi:MAG: hypothetical protein DRO88_05470 [Promethearchaeia archaeon]|nr:MAG: hypothetical protein DRO88_05470 [Candidatus Lokiarchaeia archaeon]
MNTQNKYNVIMKFGGSCLSQPEDFSQIKQILTSYFKKESKPTTIIVVVSALKGVTDLLIELTHLASTGCDHQVIARIKKIEEIHEQFIDNLFEESLKVTNSAKGELQGILHDLSTVLEEVAEFGIVPYFIDYIMSFGEKLCATLVNLFLSQENFSSKVFFGEDLIITNSEYNKAVPDLEHTRARIIQKIVPLLDNNWNHQILVITGFIGRNEIGYTTTLGRGGSDFTATIIARMLHDAQKFENGRIILWKDVPGVLSGNPEYIQAPHLISRLNYTEAKEIAVLGAKILHPKCISIIENQQIPIELRAFRQPESSEFTLISSSKVSLPIKGIEIDANAYLIILESPFLFHEMAFMQELFSFCNHNKLQLSLLQQSYSQNRLLISTIDIDMKEKLKKFQKNGHIPEEWLQIYAQPAGIITIITDQKHQAEIIAKIGKILQHSGISAHGILQDYQGITVSVVVPRINVTEIANAINLSYSLGNHQNQNLNNQDQKSNNSTIPQQNEKKEEII